MLEGRPKPYQDLWEDIFSCVPLVPSGVAFMSVLPPGKETVLGMKESLGL